MQGVLVNVAIILMQLMGWLHWPISVAFCLSQLSVMVLAVLLFGPLVLVEDSVKPEPVTGWCSQWCSWCGGWGDWTCPVGSQLLFKLLFSFLPCLAILCRMFTFPTVGALGFWLTRFSAVFCVMIFALTLLASYLFVTMCRWMIFLTTFPTL